MLLPTPNSFAQSETILINEVLYDPEGSDSGKEWIELYNKSPNQINLKDWQIQTAGSEFETTITLPDFTIEAGEHIVIGEQDVIEADIIADNLSMQNGGSATDGVRILDNHGIVIDTVLYDFPNENSLPEDIPSPKASPAEDTPSGHSLARVSFEDTDRSSHDFYPTDFLSPGAKNLFIPEVKITMPEGLYINTSLKFTSEESFDPDQNIYTWLWVVRDENDEIIDEFDTPEIETVFTEEGEYSITLTATDTTDLQATETIEFEITQDPKNPIITSIADAKKLEDGERITVEASVTSPLQCIYEKETYIQDKTGGLRIKADPELDRLEFEETYRLTGVIDTVYGEKRLNIENILPPLDALYIKPQIITPQDITPKHIGTLVTTEGKIKYIRDRYVYIETQDSTEVRIYISKYSDITTLETKEKSKFIKVTGIVSQFGLDDGDNPKIRLMPRFKSDIEISNTSSLAFTGTNFAWISMFTVFVIGLLIILRLSLNSSLNKGD